MIQHVISQLERLSEGGVFIGQTEQVLVGNDDQRVDNLLQGVDAFIGLLHTLAAFKLERLGHNTNGQHTKFTRCLCDDRSCTSTSAATHARGDKAHVRTREMINDLFNAFFGSCCANGCAGTCPQTFCHLDTHLDARLCLSMLKRLGVSVCNNKLNPVQFLLDHVVDRVAASTTHTKYSDPWFQFFLTGNGEVQCHCSVRLL